MGGGMSIAHPIQIFSKTPKLCRDYFFKSFKYPHLSQK